VLPELGEEQVSEIGMEALTAELLDHQYGFRPSSIRSRSCWSMMTKR
jgi:hypothetical protein